MGHDVPISSVLFTPLKFEKLVIYPLILNTVASEFGFRAF